MIISETAIPSPLLRPLANSLVDWAKDKDPKMLLSLGGMAIANRQDVDAPRVFAALSKIDLEPKLNGAAEILEEGYIVGAYGLILRRCAETSIPGITLLTQSYYNYPDPEAAAACVERSQQDSAIERRCLRIAQKRGGNPTQEQGYDASHP